MWLKLDLATSWRLWCEWPTEKPHFWWGRMTQEDHRGPSPALLWRHCPPALNSFASTINPGLKEGIWCGWCFCHSVYLHLTSMNNSIYTLVTKIICSFMPWALDLWFRSTFKLFWGYLAIKEKTIMIHVLSLSEWGKPRVAFFFFFCHTLQVARWGACLCSSPRCWKPHRFRAV